MRMVGEQNGRKIEKIKQKIKKKLSEKVSESKE